MKNDNDMILDRIRGVPANKSSDWRDKFHPNNPNVPQANDNDKPPQSPGAGQAVQDPR